jgi:hypothetical protein
LLALYTFYYYTGVRQRTNTIHVTTIDTAIQLKVSQNRIRKLRKILLQRGWIKDILIRDEKGRIQGKLIRGYV